MNKMVDMQKAFGAVCKYFHLWNAMECNRLYKALEEAYELTAQSEQDNEVTFWKERAREYEDMITGLVVEQAKGVKVDSIEITEEGIRFKKSQPEPRWIPVEIEPPKERRSYWVCTDTGYQCECRWTNNRFGMSELDEWGWSIFDIPQHTKVVAYMPLPKPYERSEDGEM